jgi:hypothetical protein
VGPEEANAWNNFIICVEMVPFSVFLGVAFSHREYIRGIPDSSVLRSIKEMFSVRSVPLSPPLILSASLERDDPSGVHLDSYIRGMSVLWLKGPRHVFTGHV